MKWLLFNVKERCKKDEMKLRHEKSRAAERSFLFKGVLLLLLLLLLSSSPTYLFRNSW